MPKHRIASGIHSLQMPSEQTSSPDKPTTGGTSALAQTVLLVSAGVSVFLAGGPVQGALGVFFVGAGAAMVLLPPLRPPPPVYWILGGAAVLCAALALLPATWFYSPGWRQGLACLPALTLSPTISVSPQETAFWLSIFSASVLIFLYGLGQPVRFPASLWLAVAAAGTCAVYAGLAVYAKSTGWKYLFFEENGFSSPGFGFLPNRNHAAAFLVTGCVLCPGIIATGWKTRQWMAVTFGGAALALNAGALLFYSSSRGGIVFLFVGLVLWLAGLGRTHSSRPLWISVLALTAMGMTIFFLSEGPARSRILQSLGWQLPAPQTSAAGAQPVRVTPKGGDFRIPVFLDTLGMIRDYPVTGIGLGNYASNYPFYAQRSLREEVAIHPESDWLLVATEVGPAAFILLSGALILLVRTLFAQKTGSPGWPVRWGIAAAALTAILHGLVDVPLHRPGLGFWVLVLAGMGFGGVPDQAMRRGDPLLQRVFFPAGVFLLLMGTGLIGAQWFNGHPRPPFLAGAVQNRIVELSREQAIPKAQALARETVKTLPMARSIYFQLGLLDFSSGATIADVESSFAAERALDPGRPQIPYRQGEVWRRVDPVRTAELWDEAIARHEAIHLAGGRPDRPVWMIYRDMLWEAGKDRTLLNALGEISRRDTMYRLLWLENPSTHRVFIERAAADNRFLEALNEEEKRKFLEILVAKCGRGTLAEFLKDRSGWESASWPERVRGMLASGDFATAIRSVADRYKMDLTLPSAPSDLSEPPTDFAGACAFYLQRGNTVTARRILADAVSSGSVDAIRLQAALAVREGKLSEAWKRVEAFLRSTGRSNLP